MTNINLSGPITRCNGIRAVQALGLLLLLNCFAIPRQAAACDALPTSNDTQPGLIVKAQQDHSSSESDYYLSNDNPFFAD